MTTPRKSKPAPAKRKGATAARRPAAPKKGKPAERKPDSHAAKGAPAKGARPATAVKPAAKGKTGAAGKSGRPAAPPPPVRPLGVLPASSMAKTRERPAVAVAPARPVPVVRKGAGRPDAGDAQPLGPEDIKHFEELLMVELQKIRREMGHLENTVLKVNPRDSSGDLSGYSFHMADAGTDAMEREKAFLFASVEGRKELEIRAALQRIYDGTYGVCENCGNPIPRPRLEAMPAVRLCISCEAKEAPASRSQPS